MFDNGHDDPSIVGYVDSKYVDDMNDKRYTTKTCLYSCN